VQIIEENLRSRKGRALGEISSTHSSTKQLLSAVIAGKDEKSSGSRFADFISKTLNPDRLELPLKTLSKD
jgi:hypothetical protein